ncbi:hypothetical protein NMG46_13400 [Mesorhizobium sp. LMG 17147]|uniref:hypothetical protein n=1 Tax=Mesorhizobium sp. LMG 17147 TaxID=2963091 RepID=UPI0020C97A73|nr:hypothetical protein [Mesorhizobium sp. LMG 17147]MCP9231239.1 hypothetical protein [Mesorhizobium sp. LMG 17147]
MRDNSTIVVFVAAFLFVAVLLFTLNGMFVPADPNSACVNNLCRTYRVFSEFQTLFGAGLAIFAAWYAAQPVWRQIQKMNVQQDIMAREIIERRMKSIEANGRYLDTKLSAYLQDVWRTIYDHFDDEAEYDPQSVKPEWAHNMEHGAYEILTELGRHQLSKGDTVKIEAARGEVIKTLGELSSCLNSLSAPARLAGEPGISNEQERQLEVEEKAARIEFEKIANAVDETRKAFAGIAASEIDSIRKRIRQIDDQLLRSHDD